MRTFLKSDRVFLSWLLTGYCNYRCDYCTGVPASTMAESWDVPAVIRALNATGKKWCAGITGGEPFAFPEFVAICRTLADNDVTLWIDTNLSIEQRVLEFIGAVRPGMVENMYLSLHIEERERHGGVDAFVRLVHALREKGFPFQVNYVLDPRLVHRFKKDYDFFQAQGITLLAKPYRGVYRMKLYPESYTPEERRTILKSSPDAFRRTLFYPRGVRCEAGLSLVRMLPDGTITRCVADATPLGNIHSGIELNESALPCRVQCCPCFGWDLIDDDNKKNLLKDRLADRPTLLPLLRRYAGYYALVLKKLMSHR
jgi:MoaA/NifB/PqqE/SkfB family radical SAM enzyme